MKTLLRNLLLLAFVSLGIGYADAANKFAVCTTACTWDVANADNVWRTTSGGATPTAVPGASDVAIFDAATCVGGTTCTITVNTTVTVQQITMGACTASTAGCILDFSANNNNVTLSIALSSTGTGVRTLNMGNGAWVLNSTSGTVLDFSTSTNFTFTRNSSTLSVVCGTASNNRTLQLGTSKAFPVTTFGQSGGFNYVVILAGTTPSFANIVFQSPIEIQFPAGGTVTLEAVPTWAGSAYNSVLNFRSSSTGTTATVSLASGVVNIDWASFKTIAFTGGATWTATNSFDVRGNSGISISGPSGGASPGGFVIGGG